jgi:hypothetical protein
VATATKLKVNLDLRRQQPDRSQPRARLAHQRHEARARLDPSGQTSLISPVLTIPAISGPDYTVEWLVTGTVPPGKGSVSLSIDGPSWVGVGP